MGLVGNIGETKYTKEVDKRTQRFSFVIGRKDNK